MKLQGQVLGLAGVFQAAKLVVDLAREGRCDETAAEASLGSVLRIDAADAAAVYGGARGVQVGLRQLLCEIDGMGRDAALVRIIATVLHLERKLARNDAVRDALRGGIEAAQRGADAFGAAHENVVERLAELYVGTISTMKPRVMVQGNCLHLNQPRTVARIRALLLAAVRAAVLWRQTGGSSLGFLWHRRRVAETARTLLAEA